jgi:hypothetical protein
MFGKPAWKIEAAFQPQWGTSTDMHHVQEDGFKEHY